MLNQKLYFRDSVIQPMQTKMNIQLYNSELSIILNSETQFLFLIKKAKIKSFYPENYMDS